MNVAAAFIAGFGLMENSPAVIIGAMLIAMLFGPIVGIAMALAEADLRLLRRTLAAEVVGAASVVGVGCLIGLSTRHLEIGSEILNRSLKHPLDDASGFLQWKVRVSEKRFSAHQVRTEKFFGTGKDETEKRSVQQNEKACAGSIGK
jgi:hypothetical protein